jgi:hypothetical protein
MNATWYRLVKGMGFCVLCFVAARARAGDVEGYVRDAGGAAGKDGLASVKVSLFPGTGGTVKKTTDANGYYLFQNVPTGECRIEFDRIAYSPRPRKIPSYEIKDGKNTVDDVVLYNVSGTPAYFKIAAIRFADGVRAGGSTRAAYREHWDSLREINLDPVVVARMAKAVVERDEKAADMVAGLKAYANADEKSVEKLHGLFLDAMLKGEGMPTQAVVSDLKIDDEIVSDLVVRQLKNQSATSEQRESFRERFESAWKGTSVAELLKEDPTPKTPERPRPEFQFAGRSATLLLNRSVQEELKLSDRQKDELREVSEANRAATMRAYEAGNPEKRAEVVKGIFDETEKRVAKVQETLGPDQSRRLRQIRFQVEGVNAFADPEFQKELQLTDKQKTEANEIASDVIKEIREVYRAASGDREKLSSFREKSTSLNREAIEKLNGILTDGQKRVWKEMIGEKFDFKADSPTPRRRPRLEKKGDE